MAIPNGERKGRLGPAEGKEGKKGMVAVAADPKRKNKWGARPAAKKERKEGWLWLSWRIQNRKGKGWLKLSRQIRNGKGKGWLAWRRRRKGRKEWRLGRQIPNGERKGRLGLVAEKERKKEWVAAAEIDGKTVWVAEGREIDNRGKGKGEKGTFFLRCRTSRH